MPISAAMRCVETAATPSALNSRRLVSRMRSRVLGPAAFRSVVRHPHDTDRGMLNAWRRDTVGDGDPDLERCLCSKLVELQGREQADNAPGHTERDFSKRTVLAHRCTVEGVKAASNALELAGLHQACERDGRQPRLGQVTRAQELAFAHQAHELLLVRDLGGGGRREHAFILLE